MSIYPHIPRPTNLLSFNFLSHLRVFFLRYPQKSRSMPLHIPCEWAVLSHCCFGHAHFYLPRNLTSPLHYPSAGLTGVSFVDALLESRDLYRGTQSGDQPPTITEHKHGKALHNMGLHSPSVYIDKFIFVAYHINSTIRRKIDRRVDSTS